MPNFIVKHTSGEGDFHCSAQDRHHALAMFNEKTGLNLTLEDEGLPADWVLHQIPDEPSWHSEDWPLSRSA